MKTPQMDLIKFRAFQINFPLHQTDDRDSSIADIIIIQHLNGLFKFKNEEALKFLMDTEDLDGCSTFKSGHFVSSRVEAEVSLLLQLEIPFWHKC